MYVTTTKALVCVCVCVFVFHIIFETSTKEGVP